MMSNELAEARARIELLEAAVLYQHRILQSDPAKRLASHATVVMPDGRVVVVGKSAET
jgi:hypothetical protein